MAGASDRAEVLVHEDFEHGLGERWQERGFPSIERHNRFSLGTDPDGNTYLKVESQDSYSAMGIYESFAVERCPDLRWRWRVSDIVEGADLRRKDGDDGAAKVYVVFAGPSWWRPFDKRLLVYTWATAAPVGTIVPNAWMPDRARMIVLESGRARAGEWVPERVDLHADYARAFPGAAPGEVQAIAFLADTDNTHGRAEAGIDDIQVRCRARGPEEAP